MALQSDRVGQRRRHRRARRGARLRRAAAVVAVAGEAHFLVDPLAPLHDRELGGREGRRSAAAAAAERARRRLENLIADLLHAAGSAGGLRRAHGLGDVRRLEVVERQQRLDRDVGVLVDRQGAIVGVEGAIPSLVERFAGADRLNPHARVRVLHLRANESRRRARPGPRASREHGTREQVRLRHGCFERLAEAART